MSYGNGSSTGKGLVMPYSGKMIMTVLTGINITGTVTLDLYKNGETVSGYTLTGTATAATPASLTSSGPLKDFHGNGLLALRCLTGFLRRYPVAGSKLGVEFAQHRARFCTLPQVSEPYY